MLRECTRYEALTKILLHADNFYDFFKYVEVSTFDIASDAFATFKVRTLYQMRGVGLVGPQVSSVFHFLGTTYQT